MTRMSTLLGCALLAACGPQVTYVRHGPLEMEPLPRPAATVEVLRHIPAGCQTRTIGTIKTNCSWRWQDRMRAVAAEHGADALTGFAERDLRSAPHLPRDGNVCSAVAIVFLGSCDRGRRPGT